MTPTELQAAFELLADALADRVAARLLNGQHAGWIDQATSPLGPRRHRAAVARRIKAELPGAARVGRRHLLNRDALAEELQTASEHPASKSRSVAEELRAELRLIGGQR